MEDLSVHAGGGIAGEIDHEGRDVVRVTIGARRHLARPLARLLEGLASPRCRVEHAGGAARHHGVHGHAVLGHRVRRRPREPDDAGLGGGVVRLARGAERGDGRHADDASALLLAHPHGGRAHGVEAALEVHVEDGVPVLLAHVEDHPIAEVAGDVHEDVEPSPHRHRLLHHLRCLPEVRHGTMVGDSDTAGLADLIDHLVGGRRIGADAAQTHTEIVHHDLGARLGHRDGDASPDAASRSRDHRRLAVEHPHECPP